MLGVFTAILGQRESCIAYLDLKDGFQKFVDGKERVALGTAFFVSWEYNESPCPNVLCESLKMTSVPQDLRRFEMGQNFRVRVHTFNFSETSVRAPRTKRSPQV